MAKNCNRYKFSAHVLGVLSVVQFIVIILIFNKQTSDYHIQPIDSQDEHLTTSKTTKITTTTTSTKTLKPNGALRLVKKSDHNSRLQVAVLDLPFKTAYTNASASFPHGTPDNLKHWLPSNDSYRYFQPMENRDAWLYSAFWDMAKAKTGKPTVRSFGIARRPLPWRIYCHFHLAQTNKYNTRPGFIKAFLDDHGTSVIPFALECNIPKGLPPKTVSFTFDHKAKLTNSLPIQYPGPRQRRFTVCYSALHSAFNDTSRLIQSIHLNSLLGAEHFVVYNFSISRDTDSILRYYMAKGLLTVHQWPLPTLEPWYLGQVVIINDCLFRNRNVSEFVVFVDPDEFIIPTRHNAWWEMIRAIEKNASLEEFPKFPQKVSSKGKMVTNSTTKVIHDNDNKTLNKSHELSSHHRKLLSLKQIEVTFNASVSRKSTENKQNSQRKQHESHLQPNENKMLNSFHDNIKVKEQQRQTGNQSDEEESRDASTIKKTKTAPADGNVSSTDESANILQSNETSSFSISDKHPRIGSFSFRNTFFSYKNTNFWKSVTKNFSISKDEEAFLKHFRVYSLTQYIRNDHICVHHHRSKTIVRPELVYSVGIHSVYQHVANARAAYVKSNVALLQHYRSFDYKRSNTIDVSALRFKKPLMRKLREEFSIFKNLVH